MTWITDSSRKCYSRSVGIVSWFVNMEMFYKVVILLTFLRSLECLPLEKSAKLVSYKNEVTEDSYHFAWAFSKNSLLKFFLIENLFRSSYELSDGQLREERGELEQVGDVKIFKVTGFYSFKGTDGKTYRVEYASGKDGYEAIEKITMKFKNPKHRISPGAIKTLLG